MYQSTVRLSLLGSALAPDFVTEGRCLIFGGKPGRGKTHLAVAIAYRAIQNGFDAPQRPAQSPQRHYLVFLVVAQDVAHPQRWFISPPVGVNVSVRYA